MTTVNRPTKPKRNEPCFCGSGKKYKKCCFLKASRTTEVTDLAWRKLRQTEGSVIDAHLYPYIAKKIPGDAIEIAMEDLFPAEFPESLNKDLFFSDFFFPWLLFNWIPEDACNIEQFDSQKTIALNYLQNYPNKLTSPEKRFIEAISKTYYSFYTTLEVQLDQYLRVKDVLLGTTHQIKERKATHQLKRGDVIFSRILTLDEQSIFVGMAPLTISSHYLSLLIDFKNWLIEENDNQPLTGQVLRDELDIELFDYFFEIIEDVFDSTTPKLYNTDDEPLQFSKSYFKLNITPEQALHKLLPLTLSDDINDYLKDAQHDESGNIREVTFTWSKKGNEKHGSWDNTLMGYISASTGKLVLETNSENRTKTGIKLLEKMLGKDIHFQKTLIESPEQKLKSSPDSKPDNQVSPELLESPEVQEQIKAMAHKHWQNWFDEPIPALNNQTPREAAKTDAGKERLEALFLHYENLTSKQANSNNLFTPDVEYLKSELGLT